MKKEPFVKFLDTTASTQVVTKNTLLVKEVFSFLLLHFSRFLSLIVTSCQLYFWLVKESKDLLYKRASFKCDFIAWQQETISTVISTLFQLILIERYQFKKREINPFCICDCFYFTIKYIAISLFFKMMFNMNRKVFI